MADSKRSFGVGVIGAGWLGDVHARAWARLPHHYPELQATARLVAVADSIAAARASAKVRHEYERAYADWRDLVADPQVEIVSVTAPNALHREIGVAAAQVGKHLWVEKPVGLSPLDAQEVADAVHRGGVQATVGFNYRAVPAVARLRELVRDGAIGKVTHADVRFLSDYAAHPLGLLTWRYQLGTGGHGVLGDLASHAVDLTRFVLGDLERLVAQTDIIVPERPLVSEGTNTYGHGLGEPDAPTGLVENEDSVAALIRTLSGALVSLSCSRVAVGEQNNYSIEVHGTKGLVAWDFRTPGELRLSQGDRFVDQPSQRLFVGPGSGEHGRFQPGAGIAMSFDDTKVIEAASLVRAVLSNRPEGAQVSDAVAAAHALDAMVRSAADARWVDVPSNAQPAHGVSRSISKL